MLKLVSGLVVGPVGCVQLAQAHIEDVGYFPAGEHGFTYLGGCLLYFAFFKKFKYLHAIPVNNLVGISAVFKAE